MLSTEPTDHGRVQIVLDTGGSLHLTGSLQFLENPIPAMLSLTTASDTPFDVCTTGRVTLQHSDGRTLSFKDVHFSPEVRSNLIVLSIGRLAENDISFHFDKLGVTAYSKEGTKLFYGKKNPYNIYELDYYPCAQTSLLVVPSKKVSFSPRKSARLAMKPLPGPQRPIQGKHCSLYINY